VTLADSGDDYRTLYARVSGDRRWPRHSQRQQHRSRECAQRCGRISRRIGCTAGGGAALRRVESSPEQPRTDYIKSPHQSSLVRFLHDAVSPAERALPRLSPACRRCLQSAAGEVQVVRNTRSTTGGRLIAPVTD